LIFTDINFSETIYRWLLGNNFDVKRKQDHLPMVASKQFWYLPISTSTRPFTDGCCNWEFDIYRYRRKRGHLPMASLLGEEQNNLCGIRQDVYRRFLEILILSTRKQSMARHLPMTGMRLDVYWHRKMMFTDTKKWPDIYRWLGWRLDVYRHRNNGVYRHQKRSTRHLLMSGKTRRLQTSKDDVYGHQKWWPDIYWWLEKILDVYRHRNNGVYRHQTKKTHVGASMTLTSITKYNILDMSRQDWSLAGGLTGEKQTFCH
jgi:hypothetical protein